MSDETTPGPDLLALIRQAIADPGSILPRESGETVANWGARAVLASVVQPELDQALIDLEAAKGWRDAVITERDLIRREAADLRRANASFQEINTIRTAERDQLKATVARVKALAEELIATGDVSIGGIWSDHNIEIGGDILAVLDPPAQGDDLPAVREFAAGFDPRGEAT